MHVLVGKSLVINVQAPLSRVLSSNPAVVETMATSPTQVVVEGKAAGNSSLILWDASGRSQILDVAVDIDIAGLRNAIQRSYPKEQLDVEADAGLRTQADSRRVSGFVFARHRRPGGLADGVECRMVGPRSAAPQSGSGFSRFQ